MERWYDNDGNGPRTDKNEDPWVKASYRSGWECTSRASHLIWGLWAADPIERYCLVDAPKFAYSQTFRGPRQENLL